MAETLGTEARNRNPRGVDVKGRRDTFHREGWNEFKGLLLLKVHLTRSHDSPLNAGNDIHSRLFD